jgi:lincosamide nucleotidyltransferase A/C/D/E
LISKQQEATAEMKSSDAAQLVQLMERHGIEVYVDGGWGVDALLGAQTRSHSDLDIAVPHRHVPQLREVLAARGYKEVPRADTRDCNFVLVDPAGHHVDVHSYMFDDQGSNVYGVAYLPEHLTGTGSIDGYPVTCISAEWMVRFHSGYSLNENDYRDVLALCRRFDIPVPDEYKRFTAGESKP